MTVSLLPAFALATALVGLPAFAQAAAPCWLRGVEHQGLCGSVQRALDPARPSGPQIAVHYAVLPALARNKHADPVFFFAGGPGQSAIEIAGPVSAMLARFSNRRDIVLIDQRGVGRSAPLVCDTDDPALPLAEQFSLERQRTRLNDCKQRLRALPHGDLRQYTTSIAVDDVDAVRLALGAERINLVGASYGTRVGLEYLRRYPQRVRRAVLDGIAPPDMGLQHAMSTDNQSALDALFAACAAEARCNAAEPELAARWRGLLAALPRGVEMRHPISDRIEKFTLPRDTLLGMVRGPLYAPALAAALPSALGEAARGRFDALAGLSQSLGGRKGLQMATGMHFSVVCAEDVPRPPPAAATPGRDFGEAYARFYDEVCADWPRGDVAEGFYRIGAAPAATLLLSGGLDPVTPPRHGERVAQALGAKAKHVVVPNAGHGVMGLGCLRDVLYRFVDADTDEAALQVDATCARGIPRPAMFALPGAGP